MPANRPKFDPKSLRHCTVLLLALWSVLCVTSELAARYAFPKISRVYRRIDSERKGVLALSGDRPGVLLVGNSLFEKGVDVAEMQREMPEYNVRRYVVSATSSLDWYYGLRKVLAEGAKPQTIVAGLSVRQLLAHTVEGDLSVHLLVRTSDIGSLGRDLHEDNTALSNLYFANLSGFYGTRTQFRKWLLLMLMPDVETLAAAITPPSAPYVVDDAMVATAAQHLKAMNDVCSASGARFILVVPPTGNSQETAAIAAIQDAGKRMGVTVLSPIGPGELGPAYFSDGIHLGKEGALKFTSELSSELKRTLADSMTTKVRPKERIVAAQALRDAGE